MSGGIARAGFGGGRRAASCVLSEGANELPEASMSAIESRRSILGLVAVVRADPWLYPPVPALPRSGR